MRSRQFVSMSFALVGVVLLGAGTAAQEGTPAAVTADETAEVLYVQSFASGQIEPAAREAGLATLTLEQPVGRTIYFSDRPDRIAGTIAIEQFLQILAQAETDPPNAALVAESSVGGEIVVVVELLRGEVDSAGTVRYEVRMLAGYDELDLEFAAEPLTELEEPLQLGASHLFIDGLGCNPIIDPRC